LATGEVFDQGGAGLLEVPLGEADRAGDQRGGRPKALHDGHGVGQGAGRHEQHELLTAVAGEQVGGADLGPPGGGRLLEDQVAGLVAVAVVVALKLSRSIMARPSRLIPIAWRSLSRQLTR